MSVTDNIKAIRSRKGIPQAEIARRLEIEPSSYHRLENRGDKLTLEQTENIAQALGVTKLELLTWGESTNSLKDEGECNQLQKRVLELEDRLKDKDKVIQHTELEFESLQQSVRMYVWDLIDREAISRSIGMVTLFYNNLEKQVQVEMSEYLDLLNGKEKGHIEKGYNWERIDLTDEQIKDIFYTLLKDEAFKELVSHSYLMGFLTSEKLRTMYSEYKEPGHRYKFRLFKD